MATQPEDDERVSRQVVYEHTTSTRQNMGAIIAAIVAALILIAFIVVEIRQKPPHRRSELERGGTTVVVASRLGSFRGHEVARSRGCAVGHLVTS